MPTDSMQLRKFCPRCERNRQVKFFHYHKNRNRSRYSTYCKPCTVVKVREWRQKNRSKYRDGRRKMKYGLTPDGFAALLKKQGGGCAICGSVVSGNPMCSDLCIDHCHKTKKTRGLLCHQCNTGLGYFQDDLVLLENAIRYLKQYRSE